MGIGAFSFKVLIDWTNDTSAKANNDRVAMLQQVFAKDWGAYTPYGNDIVGVGNDLTLVDNGGASTDSSVVSIAVGTDGSLGLATMSPSQECLRLRGYSLTSAPVTAPGGLPGPSSGDTVSVDRPVSAPCTGRESLPDGVPTVLYQVGGTAKLAS
jgi:hypothetical protein